MRQLHIDMYVAIALLMSLVACWYNMVSGLYNKVTFQSVGSDLHSADYTMRSIIVRAEEECSVLCIVDEQCVAFNNRYIASSNEFTCDLKNVLVTYPKWTTPLVGSSYFYYGKCQCSGRLNFEIKSHRNLHLYLHLHSGLF